MRMSVGDWLWLVVLSVLWGGSFFFVEVALVGFGPVVLVFLRVSIGAVAMLAILLAFRVRARLTGRQLLGFAVMGLFNNVVPFTLIVWGQQSIEGGLASILNGLTPMFAALIAHFATVDEKLTPHRLAGVLLGIAGVVVLIGPDALYGVADRAWGQAAVVGAAISYAGASVYGRYALRGIEPWVSAGGILGASTVILLPAAIWLGIEGGFADAGLAPWLAAIGIGVLSSAFAYIIYFHILARAGATNLGLVTLLIPASALLLGWFVLGETLAPSSFAGMAIILAGLVVIDGRVFDRRPTAVPPASP